MFLLGINGCVNIIIMKTPDTYSAAAASSLALLLAALLSSAELILAVSVFLRQVYFDLQ